MIPRINTIGYHVVGDQPHVTIIRDADPPDQEPIRTYRVRPSSAARVVDLAVSLRHAPGYGVMLGPRGWTLVRS